MKLGYRDRILLLVLCVAVILGIGIFVFIKPKWEELNKKTEELEDLETTWSQQLQGYESINTIRSNIDEKYSNALDISKNFTDEMNSVELDKFLQEQFFNNETFIKNDVSLEGQLSVSDETTTSIPYYYYTPNIVTYPLYEYADFDGSLAAAVQEKRKESDILSARTAQTIAMGTASLTVIMNREDTMSFIDAVRKFAVDNKDAMLIRSIEFAEYDFNGQPLERDANGEIIGTPPAAVEGEEQLKPEEYGYTSVNIDYEVYYMQEPTKPDTGQEYDKTIWDGDEWRTYVSPNPTTEATQ